MLSAGFVDFLWTPVNRLSLKVGENLSGATGSELNLNPLNTIATARAGPLNSDWYQPYGSVAYHFAKQLTGRARWDYYGYHEDSNGSYAPRTFRVTRLRCRCDMRFEKSEWRAIAFVP